MPTTEAGYAIEEGVSTALHCLPHLHRHIFAARRDHFAIGGPGYSFDRRVGRKVAPIVVGVAAIGGGIFSCEGVPHLRGAVAVTAARHQPFAARFPGYGHHTWAMTRAVS